LSPAYIKWLPVNRSSMDNILSVRTDGPAHFGKTAGKIYIFSLYLINNEIVKYI
jgi:hypothetical protein